MSTASIGLRLPRRRRLHASASRPLQLPLAAALGCGIVAAALLAPADVAIGAALLAFFLVLALYDTWSVVLLLLLVRSSLDVLTRTSLVAEQNVASGLALLLIAVGVAHVATQRLELRTIPLAKPFMALLGAWGLSVVVSADPLTAAEDWLRSLGTFLLFVYLASALRTPGRRQAFVAVLLLSAVVPVCFGLYQLVTGTGNDATEGFNRVFGTFVHPSPFAFYLLAVLPLAAVVYFQSRDSLTKLGLGLLSVCMLVCIVTTFTRIAWLGLLVTLVAVLSTRGRPVLLLIPLLVAALLLVVPGAQDRLFNEDNLDSGETRLATWEEALALTSPAQLPFGLGFGAVEAATGRPTHNDYLRLWVETGLLGAAAFVWLHVALYRLTQRAARSLRSGFERSLAAAFMGVLIARLVMMPTDNLLVHLVVEWYFWAFAALIVALHSANQEERSRVRPDLRYAAGASAAGVRRETGAARRS